MRSKITGHDKCYHLSSEFNQSNEASWLGTSWVAWTYFNHSTPTDSTPRYLLATCSFTPLYGRLCNVLGRKGANQTALFFAGLGVLMCGLSTNMETLIVARFVRPYYSCEFKSFSFLELVVVACSLLRRKPSLPFVSHRNLWPSSVSLSVICIAFGWVFLMH